MLNLNKLGREYRQNGFISAIDILGTSEVSHHRLALENAELEAGNMHYKTKVHTLLTSPYQLATNPAVLDIIEALIGPDILLYNVTYIIKEPHSHAHVSWHQDLTYWGFNDDTQVSMWLALSPATAQSGCMHMIPGSHRSGKKPHQATEDENNVLYSGQTVREVETNNAVVCELAPGQASFHHGWTLHTSMPNQSDDRRIGLNVQFIAPHMKQTKQTDDSAMLVRGVDNYHHFETDIAALTDFDPQAVKRQAELEARYIKIAAAK